MNDKLKEIYKTISPTKGDTDLAIYQQYHKFHKSVNDLAYEFEKDTSSIYRAIQRVESFLNRDLSYYDYENFIYILPRHSRLDGVESILSYKLVVMALAIFYTTGEEYLDKFYCNLIQNMHPYIKNNKRKIANEIESAYWCFWETGEKIYIFDSVIYSRNRIDFKINDLAKIIILSAKSDIEETT